MSDRNHSTLDREWCRFVQSPLGRLALLDAEMMRFQSTRAVRPDERRRSALNFPYIAKGQQIADLSELVAMFIGGERLGPEFMASEDGMGRFLPALNKILRGTHTYFEEEGNGVGWVGIGTVFPLFGKAGRIFGALAEETRRLSILPDQNIPVMTASAAGSLRLALKELVDWVAYAFDGTEELSLSDLCLPRVDINFVTGGLSYHEKWG